MTGLRPSTTSRSRTIRVRSWRGGGCRKRYGAQLLARGKKGGVIGCAMAHRANKIAYALVRDQAGYDSTRWA